MVHSAEDRSCFKIGTERRASGGAGKTMIRSEYLMIVDLALLKITVFFIFPSWGNL